MNKDSFIKMRCNIKKCINNCNFGFEIKCLITVKYTFTLALCICFVAQVIGQNSTEYNSKRYSIKQKGVVSPRNSEPSYNPYLKNLEAPTPGGQSRKSHLLRQKIKSRAQFPITPSSKKLKTNVASNPKLGIDYGMYWYTNSGKKREISGGSPNDNTLAVSNEGIVISALNSSIYAYDLKIDTLALDKQKISLATMAGASFNSTSHYFDPKLIYDEKADRFILVFLKDTSPGTNKIVVCFSTSNNPNDDWNVYEIPGNPLDNNRWTDFPAISLTDEDLFITGNLIIPNVTWQVGFDRSIIWQIEKETGYTNATDLNAKLYSEIKFENKYIRNLHVVRGANGVTDKQYLLSNRNFDITNDTIFVLDIEGHLSSESSELNVNYGITDLAYGVPPNARQADTDTSDPTQGLQTNDARVLAAIKHKDEIQFVSNSMNFETGFSSIYHGVISNLEMPEITGHLISDPIKDFGYPNIAWTGNEECDKEVIIAFNHTSPVDFPGISCVYVDNEKSYSDVVILKEGEGYVNKLGGGYERWGDYFGLQRKYNEPGKVVSFGFYGTSINTNTGWHNEIFSPDTSMLGMTYKYSNSSISCLQTVEVIPNGGVAPYSYSWEDYPEFTTNISPKMCLDDSLLVHITDDRGCTIQQYIHSKLVEVEGEGAAYPNPFINQFIVQFKLSEASKIEASIFDVKGNLVDEVLQQNTKTGINELVFSLEPLQSGVYIVKVKANGKQIVKEKVVKY